MSHHTPIRWFLLLTALLAGCAASADRNAAPAPGGGMTVSREVYGAMPDGTPVDLFTLDNARGMKVRVMTWGATLIGVDVPDRTGRTANVVLYLDSFSQYLAGHPGFGSVIGRYANRIARGRFTLDGTEYTLATNSGVNHIHGGRRGFDKAVWKAQPVRGDGFVGVRLTHTSPDGDEGYPGTLTATVTYALTATNELRMEYAATTDKPTHVNLTNHSYWNLAGAGSGNVYGHRLTLFADRYLAVDAGLIPTGDRASVEGTPFDFRTPETLGARIGQLPATGGYDHCYVINRKTPGELVCMARVVEPAGGRVMEVWTTCPGVQLYTANGLNGRLGANGRTYEKHGALCLETQHFPDSPNHPDFPSTVLRPGQTYRQTTVHKFSVE